MSHSSSASENGDQDEGDFGEIDRYWPPPIEESVELTGSYNSRTVSAFAFNNSGTRFATGGHDYEVRIWDFEAIDRDRPEAVCNSQPSGQTIIKNLQFSNDDELILVISGSCQASIIAKDGIVSKQYQCPKGDQYISDMTNTKGHVQMLNDGCWSPKDKGQFITCSNDSTIRIWDLETLNQKQKTVIKTRSPASGLKAVPNVCKYNRDSLSILAGCNDGSVLVWDTRRKFITTSACIKNAHLKGSEITGVDFAYGNQSLICTRSEDETCKLWDLRQLKTPLAARTDLPTQYSTTDCSFSPDDKLILTATSSTKQESGKIHFLDSTDLSIKQSIESSSGETSIIRARWHPKINHIGYSCSSGSCFVAYDKRRSIGGFLTVAFSRGSKRKKYVSQRNHNQAITKIITPHALPLFKEDNQTKKKQYKPDMPNPNANQDGRIMAAGSTLSSYIARNIAKPIDHGDMNIRDRILRHAEEAEKDPKWINDKNPKLQPNIEEFDSDED